MKKGLSKLTTLIDTTKHEHKKQYSTPNKSRKSQRESTGRIHKTKRYITEKRVKSISSQKLPKEQKMQKRKKLSISFCIRGM